MKSRQNKTMDGEAAESSQIQMNRDRTRQIR